MLTRLLLILSVTGHIFTKEPPDVGCLVIHFQHVQCNWTSHVNYNFSSRFLKRSVNGKLFSQCATYMWKNGTHVGCIQPYVRSDRFTSFITRLSDGNQTFDKTHDLKRKVRLYPPVNVTVKNGSDFNLWFYWNQTAATCVESEVRHRVNDKKWETSIVKLGYQSYCINLPFSNSRYELQVRSKVDRSCGDSEFWSDWSQLAVWGNSTVNQMNGSPPVWAHLLYVLGVITIVVILVLFLPQRFRLVPLAIPKPALVLYDIEDWLQYSKGLKGNLNYNEHACPVRECCHGSESDCSSTDGSTCTVITCQTNCSVPADKSEGLSTSCSSSTGLLSSQAEEQEQEEVQVSV